MNTKTLLMGMTAGLGLLASQQSQAINLTFGNIPTDNIVFTGSTSPAGSVEFETSIEGGHTANTWVFTTLNPVGNTSRINALFSIGTITPAVGNNQSAPLTDNTPGGASLTIWDINNVALTAKIHLNTIENNFHNGVNGGNSAGDFFLDTISASLDSFSNYTGADAELFALAHGTDGSINLSFTFTQPGYTLTQLATGDLKKTSYSGTLASSVRVPDGGATLISLGVALSALGMLKRRMA